MANFLGDPLKLGLYRKPPSRAAISIIPGSIISAPDQIFLTVITVQNKLAGNSVVITQSGDFVDADFDDTLVNTVAAAAAAATGVTFNVGTRRLTFAANFSGAFSFLRTVTIDPTVGQEHVLTLSAPQGGLTVSIASAILTTVVEPIVDVPPEPLNLIAGINMSSGEFGGTDVYTYGSSYLFPSNANILHFYNRGMRNFRVPFRWGRTQPIFQGESDWADWLTATPYAVADIVQTDAATAYKCLVAHTSGTFATDLAAGKWEIYVENTLAVLDVGHLDRIAAYIATLPGAIFIPDAHEFIGRRPTASQPGAKLGSAEVPAGSLGAFWAKLAADTRNGISWTDYGDQVRLGLFNEPQSFIKDVDGLALSADNSWSAEEWKLIALAEIAAARAGGVTQTIHIPGCSWTGAHSWIEAGNGDAWAWANLSAPQRALLDNTVFEVHQYLDSDSSGSHPDATVGAGSSRLIAITDWARTNGYTKDNVAGKPEGIYLGEIGFADNPQMVIEFQAAINYSLANEDVWIGFSIWAAGQFWNQSYMYLLEPANGAASNYTNPIDKPQMYVVMDMFLPIANNLPPTDISLSSSVMSSVSAPGVAIGELTATDPNFGLGDFPRFFLTDNAGGRLDVYGKEIRYGTVPPDDGQTYQATVQVMDRGGLTFLKTFSFPVLTAPNVALSRVGASTVDEGQNFVLRHTVSAVVPGTGWTFWVSGNVAAQMVGSFESVVRAAFEAKGYKVVRDISTRMRISMLPGSQAGTIDVTWPTLADAQTEGANFQANFFIDTPIGVTLGSAVVTNFIRDTSVTPGWAISVGAGSAFPGDTITTQIMLANPAIGAKVIVTPGGVANDADFTATFDSVVAAAVALETGLTYNTGTNELAVTGAWDGTLTFNRVVAIDDDPDETYTVTLSSPTASVIATAVATVLIRQQQGTATVTSINYAAGETTNTTQLPHTNIVQYENLGGTWSEIAANALVIGSKGLLLAPPITNLVKNPRGEGGTLGSTTSKPTNWSWGSSGNTQWRFDSRGVENGVPYCQFTRVTSSGGGFFIPTLITEIPITGAQQFAVKIGFSCISGTFTAAVGGRAYSATQAGGAQVFDAVFTVGPNRVWLEKNVVFTQSTASTYMQPQVQVTSSAGAVVRVYAPSVRVVPVLTGPGVTGTLPSDGRAVVAPMPPIGTLAAYGNTALAVDLAFTPPTEGTFILDFYSVARWGGECLLSLYSDTDNFIEVRQHIFGALDLVVSVNGSLVVNLTNPVTETAGGYIMAGKRHRFELVYGLFDVRLALDGRLLCSAAPTSIPVVNAVRIGRDRNGANHAHMSVNRLTYRDDLRSTDDALIDTTKPGVLGSPGINMTGGEFGSVFPGINRQHYFFSDGFQNDKSAGGAYWRDKLGVGTHQRMPFKWQRVQPVLLGALDTTTDVGQGLGAIGYLGLMDKQANDFYSQGGVTCIVDMHNYGSSRINDTRPEFASLQYDSNIPDAPTTTAAWIDCWTRLATHYLGNPAIKGFDLMNEDFLGLDITQQLVNAIAAIDPNRVLYVEGAFAAALGRWPSNSSDTLKSLTHPNGVDKIVFSAHKYYDNNGSGVYPNDYNSQRATPETGLWSAIAFNNWQITNGLTGRRAHVGETGAPTNLANADYTLTVSNSVKIYHEYGWEVSAWLAGEAVGNASMSLEPTGIAGAKVDRYGLIAWTRHKYQAPGVVIQDFVLSASTVVSGTAAGTTIGNITASNGGTITGLTLIDTQGNRFALTALALKTGATATNFATAQQHVIVLNGLIDGVQRTQSLTITVTQVVTAPAIFVMAQNSIVSGSVAGTLVGPVTSDTGAPVTSLTIPGTASSRFALSGNNVIAGSVATDFAVATVHSIDLSGLIGGVSHSQTLTVNVTPAPAQREFFLSANFIQSGAVQGTLVGLVQSTDGIVSNLTLSDSAGNRFQIGANNRLEAGSVATNVGSATSHSIVIDGLIGGVSSSTPFVISVTPAAGPTFVFLDPAEIPSGTGPGVLISRMGSSNGNELNTFTLMDTAGNRFAVQVITATPRLYGIFTGSVATNIATATSHQITMRANHGPTGPLVTQVATIVVKPAVAVETYNLSSAAVTSGAAPSTFVGTFSGSAGGALTGLSLTQTAGSRFALSGNNLVTGATATDFATNSSHLITLTGSIGGTVHTQDFIIAVNSTGFGLVNLGVLRSGGTNNALARNVWDLFTSGTKIWGGTGDSGSNAGTGDLLYVNVLNDTIVNSGFLDDTIKEQQAERFKFIDGAVTFPGIDPDGSGPVKYFREESGTWVIHIIAPGSNPRQHTLDVYKFNNMYFSSHGTDNVSYWDIFAKTTDPTGVTGWAATQTSADVIAARGSVFFEHSGSFYAGVYFGAYPAVNWIPTSDGLNAVCVKWNGTKFSLTGAPNRTQLFPGMADFNELQASQIQRPVSVGTYLIYVGVWATGDAQWLGRGLYVATANFATITKVPLLTAEVSWDIISRGSTAYVLTSQLKSSNPQVFTIRVRSSVAPFSTWTEIVNFDQPTFARSFEEYGGAYYLGLGTDRGVANEGSVPSYTDVVKAESGNILKWTPAVGGGGGADVTVALTLTNTHQTMQGFGSTAVMFDHPHLWNNFDAATGRSLTTMTQAQKDVIYDKLYTDLKLTRVRLDLGAGIEFPNNDNADPLVTDLTKFNFAGLGCDDFIVYAQAAIARGATTIWISPITPEPWMSAATDQREYIELTMAILNRWQTAGVELDYWGICNEPSYTRYPRTAAYVRDATKLLGAAMASAGMTTQIVAADDIRASATTALATTTLVDAVARPYVGAIATHLYDQAVSNMTGLKALGVTYSLPVWMSEFSITGMPSAGLPATAFEWAKLMHSLIATYDVTAVDYMWGAFGQWSSSGNDSLISLNNSGATYQGFTLKKQYYMTGQYSRFVPVGAVRVDAVSDDATVLVSAFKTGAAITIVAINNSAQSPTVAFTGLTGKTSVSVVRTSTTEDWAVRTPIAVSGGAFTAVLTPNSVTTFTTP